MKNKKLWIITLLTLNACVALAQPEQQAESVIQGVNYVGLGVSDLDSATSFYSNATDLQVVTESTLENSPALNTLAGREVVIKTRLLRSSNAQIRFMEFANQSASGATAPSLQVYGPGLAHLCFQVADSTKTYDRFLAAGAAPIGVTEMVQLNPRNPVVYAYARDKDGTIFEVEHIDFSKVSTTRKNDYRIRHISLATPNIESMVNFYSQLMAEPNPRRLGRAGEISGEVFDKVSGYPDVEIEMAWFQVRNLELEIMQYRSHPTQPLSSPRPLDAYGYNMVVFDVSNLDSLADTLVAAGGSVVSGIEPMDGGQILFGRDPDGNLLGFQLLDQDSPLSSRNFADNGI